MTLRLAIVVIATPNPGTTKTAVAVKVGKKADTGHKFWVCHVTPYTNAKLVAMLLEVPDASI